MNASDRPDVFLTQIDDQIEAVTEQIGIILERAAEAVNRDINSPARLIGSIAFGPLGGMLAERAARRLREQYEAAVADINQKWQDSARTIRRSVGSILGDPPKMSAIASAYDDAVAQLGDIRGLVASTDALLGESWEGRSFVAYQSTSATQVDAMRGMSDLLIDASALMTNHAVQLLQFWNEQLANLVRLVAQLVSAASGIADAGNWLTLGVGTILDLLATAASGAASIAEATGNYFIELNVGRAGDWHSLDSQFGNNGLPGRSWPDFDKVDLANINGPWTQAS